MSVRLVALVAASALLGTGCTAASRPYGTAAGLIVSAVGAGFVIDARTTDCGDGLDGLGCGIGSVVEAGFGAGLLLGGVVALLVAAASSPTDSHAIAAHAPSATLQPATPRQSATQPQPATTPQPATQPQPAPLQQPAPPQQPAPRPPCAPCPDGTSQ